MFSSLRPWRRAGLVTLALMLVIALVSPGSSRAQTTPGAPILLITDSSAPNPFGAYLGEILRAEGLMSFDTKDIAAITGASLQPYPVVLLAEMTLSQTAAELLKSYVASGGRLIAMRPGPLLDDLCGWSAAGSPIDSGYIAIKTDAGPGKGLLATHMQFHGQADLHTSAADSIAGLYPTGSGAQAGTAISIQSSAGAGAASCWAYDLAKSIVLTRQGNPANADIDVDGDGVFRTIDLFQASGNGAPWVDRDRIGMPQADEQMRLLSHIVEDFLASAAPLPRLWYFPDGAMSMLVLTGDAHANPLSYYEKELNSLNAHGGKITLYLSAAGDPPDSAVQKWRQQGHEIGIHPYAAKPDPSPALAITSLAQGYDLFDKWFAAQFSSPKSRTARNHQVAWKGWTDAADIAVAHGIALDANFYAWGAWLKNSDGAWPHGYVTGSGQPMRFVRADGTVLPLYQQLTELVDEQLLKGVGFGYEELDAKKALDVSRQLIDASLAGNYAALMTQFHVDTYGFGDPQIWAEGTLDYARSKGLPIWNADQWLNFTETRHDAQLSGLSWVPGSGQLGFTLQSSVATTHTLTLMIPASGPTGALIGLTADGVSQKLSVQNIKGRQYAMLTIAPGRRQIQASYPGQGIASPSLSASNGGSLLNVLIDQFQRVTEVLSSASPTAKIVAIALALFGLVLGFGVRTGRARKYAGWLRRQAHLPRFRAIGRPRERRAPHSQRAEPSLAHISAVRVRQALWRSQRHMTRFSTVQDFSSLGAASPTFVNTVVSEDGDGEISLRADLEDYFRTNSLNSALWASGLCLIGMPDITVGDGALRITSLLTGGGFVHSIRARRHGVLEGVVAFGAGQDQHFGWAAPRFVSDQYAVFSTNDTTDTLFVRTNNLDREQLTSVGAISGPLLLRIEWTDASRGQDVIRYYVNTRLVATHTVNQLPALCIHLWNNTLGTRTLRADWVRYTPYAAASGTYLSCPIAIDPDKQQAWGPVRIDATTPPGTNLTVEVRTSNDQIDWSEFVAVANGETPKVPQGVYLQYRATLTATADRMTTPKLNAIGIGHSEVALPPGTLIISS